jgi:hypothetical protein
VASIDAAMIPAVLGDEQEDPGHRDADQDVHRHRGAERRGAEQPQVDQGVGDPQLPPGEHHSGGTPCDEREQGGGVDAALGGPLHAVDQGEHRDDRQRRARDVEPARRRVADLGQQPRAHQQQQRHDGQVDQEHRAPPEVLQQHPRDERADHGAGGEGGDPQPDRDRALCRVGEQAAQQRQRGRHQGRTRDPEQCAGEYQQLRGRRERREQARQAERGGPGQQQPPAADPVAEGAHRDERPGDQEAVDVGDPQQLGAARAQRGAQRGRREDEDHEVHRDDQRGQHERGQGGPLAPARPDGWRIGCGHDLLHFITYRNVTEG